MSSFVQIMACCLFSNKPLCGPMLTCAIAPSGAILCNILIDIQINFTWKWLMKWRLFFLDLNVLILKKAVSIRALPYYLQGYYFHGALFSVTFFTIQYLSIYVTKSVRFLIMIVSSNVYTTLGCIIMTVINNIFWKIFDMQYITIIQMIQVGHNITVRVCALWYLYSYLQSLMRCISWRL